MKPIIVLLGLAALCQQPILAQFSGDLPGVPKAGIPTAGTAQGRTSFDFSGFRVDGELGREAAGRVGLDWGRSYRIGANFELGFDLALMSGTMSQTPTVSESGEKLAETRFMAAYGLAVGAKVRPISFVTPEGFGWELALAVGYAPGWKPLYALRYFQDTTYHAGWLGKAKGPAFVDDSPATLIVGPVASFRSKLLAADAALMSETGADVETASMPVFRRFGLRAGARLRLLESLSAGFSWWGTGAPPWRNRQLVGSLEENAGFAFVLGGGSMRESGTDVVIASPTGDFSESISLFIRTRTSF